jgi:hypothetical protein
VRHYEVNGRASAECYGWCRATAPYRQTGLRKSPVPIPAAGAPTGQILYDPSALAKLIRERDPVTECLYEIRAPKRLFRLEPASRHQS